MKHLSILVILSLSGLFATANAATFDFVTEGQLHEFGYASFDSDTDATATMPGGLTITASNGAGTPYAAYFDGYSSGSPGGLGVCQRGVGTACAGNSDDNQMPGEYIHMLFDGGAVNLDSITVTGDHGFVNPFTVLHYSVNSGADMLLNIWDTSLASAVDNTLHLSTFVLGLIGVNTFDYHITFECPSPSSIATSTASSDPCDAGGQMYLAAMDVSEVPVPAAFWLFGTALLGFISYSRRTRV